ncbi:MAG: TIGR02391 family protein [Methyloceanibacter sp.]
MATRGMQNQGALLPSNLSPQQIREAIPKLERRLNELEETTIDRWDERKKVELDALQMKIEETVTNVFGSHTLEAKRYRVARFSTNVRYSNADEEEWAEAYKRGIIDAISKLKTAISMLREQLEDLGGRGRALRAYEGLDLHPEIDRAASALYRDGHYANAIEDSVKALNGLVRLRSGLEEDGVTLMQRAFSPKNPVLRFNDLADQWDKDEQLGYMNMFSGAVSGLRNPRAHKLIQDDPERALEFIAFISLLAKLLDGAKKAT